MNQFLLIICQFNKYGFFSYYVYFYLQVKKSIVSSYIDWRKSRCHLLDVHSFRYILDVTSQIVKHIKYVCYYSALSHYYYREY